jgi:predicted ATPase
MRVETISLTNFRSFVDSGSIELTDITLLIGANNSGKSSVLRGLALLQQNSKVTPADVRMGESTATVRIGLSAMLPPLPGSPHDGVYEATLQTPDRRGWSQQIFQVRSVNGGVGGAAPLPAIAPHHFIVPFLTSRKVMTYNEDVREQNALQINDTMTFLAARLSTVSNQHHPRNAAYTAACERILGFPVTCVPSPGGQQPGVYLPDGSSLSITQLGEGVPQIVTLLAELALCREKLFLIEEPENDLHPMALKELLDLILVSAQENQFVISTHSNIVLTQLGASPATTVYEVDAPRELPTTATLRKVAPEPQARLEVLRSLGYALSDFDLWDGWLFLEEASAERIIRDCFIPWFVPQLSRVRTVSCEGAGKVDPSVEDFYRLVRFTHLEHVYKNSTWVRVDNDEAGKDAIKKLHSRFPTWERDRFGCFTKAAFEQYYPPRFADAVARTLAVNDRQAKRDTKRALLATVLEWIKTEPDVARVEFEMSAQDVIEDLRAIALALH